MLEKTFVKDLIQRVCSRKLARIERISSHSDKYLISFSPGSVSKRLSSASRFEAFGDLVVIIYSNREYYEQETEVLRDLSSVTPIVPRPVYSRSIIIEKKRYYIGFFTRLEGIRLSDTDMELDEKVIVSDLIDFLALLRKVRVKEEVSWKENLKAGMDHLPKDKRGFLLENISAPNHYCLIHGDLAPDNILIDERSGRVCGIVDFTTSYFGDPLQEYVVFYVWRLVLQDSKKQALERIYSRLWDHYSARKMISSYNFVSYFAALMPRFRDKNTRLMLNKHLLELLFTNFTLR